MCLLTTQSCVPYTSVDTVTTRARHPPRRMCLKGVGEDHLVLCTDDKTYAIQLVETSNAVLLCSEPGEPTDASAAAVAKVLEGRVGCTHELKQTAPRLHRLRELLEADTFTGPDEELVTLERWWRESDGAPRGSSPEPLEQTAAAPELFDESLMEVEGGGGSGGHAHTPSRKRRAQHPLEVHLPAARDGPGYTFDELDELVQASSTELARGLTELRAVLLDPRTATAVAVERGGSTAGLPLTPTPRYRVLSPSFTRRVLRDILTAVTGMQWHPGAVPLTGLLHACDQHPPAVVAHVAATHSAHTAGDAMEDTPTLALDFTAWAVVRGQEMLEICEENAIGAKARGSGGGSGGSSGGLEYHSPVADFVRTWNMTTAGVWPSVTSEGGGGGGGGTRSSDDGPWTPRDLHIDLLRARALVLLDTTATGVPVLRHFPEDRLSHEPKERFKQLFSARGKWSMADLSPYLSPLVGVGLKMDDMVVSSCRSTLQPDGSRVFSAR